MFYCLDVHLYHLWDKRRFVFAHIGQNRDIYPPSICGVHFDSYTPSPFCAGWRWGLLSRKIFSDFIFFRFSYSISTRILNFLFFSDFRLDSCFGSVFQIILFNYFDSIKVCHLILDSIFRNIHRFDSLQVLLDIYSFAILVFASEFLLASISTCFSIVDSMLWLFDSLSLRLFCLL